MKPNEICEVSLGDFFNTFGKSRRTMKKVCGIYRITSPSGKIYIGQSTNIYGRFYYYSLLQHCNRQRKLYNSFLKYGVDKHKFEIICQCKKEKLNKLEIYYIELFNSFNSENGLNLRHGGGSKGKHSEETKRRISESNKKTFSNPELRDRIRKAATGNNNMYGKKMSEEAKRKISVANKGEKNGMWGKKLSEETKRKIGNASKGNKNCLGRKLSDEHKKKIGDASRGERNHSFGKKRSEEEKENIRKKLTGRKRTKEANEKTTKTLISTWKRKKEQGIGVPCRKILLDTETGIFYIGLKSAAESIGITDGYLINILKGRTKRKTKFIYV